MTPPSSQKICIVVKSDSEDGLIEKLGLVPPSAGFVEIRYDYLKVEKPTISLVEIRKMIKQKALFTCRFEKYGGEYVETIDSWKETARQANLAKFDYIDVDYGLTKELDYKKLKESFDFSKIILSYHNFNHTPPYLKLKKILKSMKGLDPEIYKFATKIKQEKDMESLFKLLLNKQKKAKMVCLGMGQPGIKTRVLSVLLGAELTFASLEEGQETADGQLSFGELCKGLEEAEKLFG